MSDEDVISDDAFDSSPRPAKKRRTAKASKPPRTGVQAGTKKRRSEAAAAQSRRKSISSFSSIEGSDDYFEDVTAKVANPSRSRSRDVDDDEDEESTKKPKHKWHIPQNNHLLEDIYLTQEPPPSSNPWEIRGPIWKKQPPPQPAKPVSRAMEAPARPTTGTSNTFAKSTLPSISRTASHTATNVRHPPVFRMPAGTTTAAPVQKLPPPAPRPTHTVANASNEETSVGLSTANGRETSVPFTDLHEELADLPSDAFESSQSSSPTKSPDKAIYISSQPTTTQAHRHNLAAPQAGLRQTTLFGGTVEKLSEASQANKKHAWPLATQVEPRSHHEIDEAAAATWVYPTNLGTTRDYQYNIVARGLFHNLLVALPTGLGKTFIAATVMLNWYRWTKDAQIVFVAPTKPLVSQQVDACFHIVGIPRSDTVMLTGNISPGLRAEAWREKRVFFMTPQTIMNDLKTGIADPKKIVLLVVDEAHRATGSYAYVEVVKFLRRFNQSFRVLALTATPGSTVESVQQVIDGLDISRVEIRTETSLDIRQYVHMRDTDTITFDYSDEQELIMDLFGKTLKPLLDKLASQNAYWSRDPMKLTAFGLTQARKKWMSSDAGRKASQPIKAMVNSLINVLSSLAHSLSLLKFHGIGPFYSGVLAFRKTVESGQTKSKYSKQICDDENFNKLTNTIRAWTNNPDFLGHPKLDYLRSVVLNHFLDAGEGRAANGGPPSATRIMVFAHFRDSAEEIVRVLKRNEPMIRPHVFVGQAASKGSEGMDQKKQLDVIQKFKDGVYNTLVATSIGEEGLDIGEVDLIVCYDSSSSPIRMLQRMGRTGRKRKGNIVLLLMKDKEERDFEQAKDNYEKMQAMIASGTRFTFHDDRSPRILPKEIQPAVDKRVVEIPVENSQADLPEPKKKGRVPKRPPKKFHMPDNVRTGFTIASRMDEDGDEGGEPDIRQLLQGSKKKKTAQVSSRKQKTPGKPKEQEEEITQLPFLEDVILNRIQERELMRKYQYVCDTDGAQTVSAPRADRFPDVFRKLGKTKYVNHGRVTADIARMLDKVHAMNGDRAQDLREGLNKGDLTGNVDDILVLEGDLPQHADDGEADLPALPARGKKAAPAKKRAPKTPARNRRQTSYPDTGAAMEADSSSPEPTPADMRIATQGIDLGSADTSGEDDDEMIDPESELADFVVGSDAPIEVMSSSMPGEIEQRRQRHLFTSQEVLDEDSEVELPELPAVDGWAGNGSEEEEREEPVLAARKRGNRRVVEEDSDE
ncbi:3'-5' DNA helicase [Zalaria obscura]|uniref:3'-5' DNA helicase n=1 Tax=Zalaria obscura TaxID=2024903 RepID=A0ACC3SEN2_9PEZI